MTPKRALAVLLIVLALLLPACKLTSSLGGAGTASPDVSPTSPASNDVAPVDVQDAYTSRGPGDFDLVDPAAGLDGLNSYRQTLQIDFDGYIDGEAQQTSTIFTRLVDRSTQTELTWLQTGEEPEMFFGHAGEWTYHQVTPDSPCVTSSQGDSPDPAPAAFTLASLPTVLGAEVVEDDAVNGITALHYTFDEKALGYDGQAKATGEVWVAESGGYVLRYSLQLEAPTDLLGPGVSGVQTWLYELSEVDSLVLDLPEACLAQQDAFDVPLMDGAEVTSSLPGFQEYQVAASLDEAVAFYQEQAESMGWTADAPFQFSEVTRLALHLPDGGLVQLTFKTNGDTLTVTIQALAAAAPAE